MIYRFLTSILFFFFRDPETIHRLAILFLWVLGLWPFSALMKALTRVRTASLAQTVFGLRFENPVGLAGGFDKNGKAIAGLEALGFGFLELGTVTKFPQAGNPRPRIFRFSRDGAIVNRMGMNNDGTERVAERLVHTHAQVPLGISLGKSKTTEQNDATSDYRYSFEKLYSFGDYFAINVSSPNTPGLRDLQDKKFLTEICTALDAYRKTQVTRKPILVKIAPDLSFEAIDEVLEVAKNSHVDGIIAVNTTVSREGLSAPTEEAGGMSGKPLAKRSTEIIRYIRQKAPELPIVGVGGVFTAEDAYEKIRAGAALIQIYTGFIYEGPFAARNINRGLVFLLARDGFKNISEAVGVDAK